MKNPRIHVTLPLKTYDAIDRIARSLGTSRSAIISDILTEQTEVLQQLAVTLRQASVIKGKLPLTAQAKLAMLEGVAEQNLSQSRQALDDVQDVLTSVRKDVERHDRDVRAAGACGRERDGLRPSATNRGAKPQLTGAWKDL